MAIDILHLINLTLTLTLNPNPNPNPNQVFGLQAANDGRQARIDLLTSELSASMVKMAVLAGP